MAEKGVPAVHPGEFLAEALEDLGLSQAAFARAIGVSPMRISHVIKGSRPVTAELALLFRTGIDQLLTILARPLPGRLRLETAEASIGPRLRAVHSDARVILHCHPSRASTTQRIID